jgi:hypothetical protein
MYSDNKIQHQLDEILTRSMQRSSSTQGEISRHRLVLANFLAGRIDPQPDERLVNVQTWALLMAREHGATTPREALDMIREFSISDDEWENSRSVWDLVWRGLPGSD